MLYHLAWFSFYFGSFFGFPLFFLLSLPASLFTCFSSFLLRSDSVNSHKYATIFYNLWFNFNLYSWLVVRWPHNFFSVFSLSYSIVDASSSSKLQDSIPYRSVSFSCVYIFIFYLDENFICYSVQWKAMMVFIYLYFLIWKCFFFGTGAASQR